MLPNTYGAAANILIKEIIKIIESITDKALNLISFPGTKINIKKSNLILSEYTGTMNFSKIQNFYFFWGRAKNCGVGFMFSGSR